MMIMCALCLWKNTEISVTLQWRKSSSVNKVFSWFCSQWTPVSDQRKTSKIGCLLFLLSHFLYYPELLLVAWPLFSVWSNPLTLLMYFKECLSRYSALNPPQAACHTCPQYQVLWLIESFNRPVAMGLGRLFLLEVALGWHLLQFFSSLPSGQSLKPLQRKRPMMQWTPLAQAKNVGAHFDLTLARTGTGWRLRGSSGKRSRGLVKGWEYLANFQNHV